MLRFSFSLLLISSFFFSQITSTAGGGTLTLEFGVLSRLTNDPGQWTSWTLVFHVSDTNQFSHWEILLFTPVFSLIVCSVFFRLLTLLYWSFRTSCKECGEGTMGTSLNSRLGWCSHQCLYRWMDTKGNTYIFVHKLNKKGPLYWGSSSFHWGILLPQNNLVFSFITQVLNGGVYLAGCWYRNKHWFLLRVSPQGLYTIWGWGISLHFSRSLRVCNAPPSQGSLVKLS